MAEITTRENETGELEIFTTPPPTILSANQIENFSKIIKDNSPYLQDQIKDLKKRFPEDLGNVSSFSDAEISNFTGVISDEFQDRLCL